MEGGISTILVVLMGEIFLEVVAFDLLRCGAYFKAIIPTIGMLFGALIILSWFNE